MAVVQSSQITNTWIQHLVYYGLDALLLAQPKVSKHLRQIVILADWLLYYVTLSAAPLGV